MTAATLSEHDVLVNLVSIDIPIHQMPLWYLPAEAHTRVRIESEGSRPNVVQRVND